MPVAFISVLFGSMLERILLKNNRRTAYKKPVGWFVHVVVFVTLFVCVLGCLLVFFSSCFDLWLFFGVCWMSGYCNHENSETFVRPENFKWI